jgi:hypothetical protein
MIGPPRVRFFLSFSKSLNFEFFGQLKGINVDDLVIFVHANQDKLEALQSCLPITYELVRSSSQLLKIL